MSTQLTPQDYQNAANRLGVSVAAVRAVAETESNGSGFLADGKRVKVQYEPHVMYQRLKLKFGPARAQRELAAHPDLVALKPGSYQNTDKEDRDMDRAATAIDRACALESASWGAFQIMGYHWQRLGYASVADFVSRMARDENEQFEAFVRFIEADPVLHKALKGKKWAQFAKAYNGPAYARNLYDVKLERAYERHASCACSKAAA